MKKLINYLTLTLLLCMGFAVTSCGNDEPSDNKNSYSEYDFVGYWIDDAEATVFEFKTDGKLIAYELEKPGSLFYINNFTGQWRYNNDELIFRWNNDYPQSNVTSQGNTNNFKVESLSSNKITMKDTDGWTIVLERHTGSLKPKGEDPVNPDTPQFKESDFYGLWLNGIKSGYYEFKADNTAKYYWLSETGGNTLTGESDSGKWYFDAETSKLHITNFKELSNKYWEVYEVTSSSIKTDMGVWQRATSLPPVDSRVSDDSRIFGTWEGTDYVDKIEIEFKEDGHLIERWEGEYNVTMFTLKNGIMYLDKELGVVLSNTLGDSFSCTFITDTKIKLFTSWYDITLTKIK